MVGKGHVAFTGGIIGYSAIGHGHPRSESIYVRRAEKEKQERADKAWTSRGSTPPAHVHAYKCARSLQIDRECIEGSISQSTTIGARLINSLHN
jgi:hypothetical protein